MSDEEIKAIKKLESLILYLSKWNKDFTVVPADMKYLVPIFNLIQKQSKEIEELKDTNKKLYEMGKQNAIQELINNDYIRKDKIKAKIEECKKEKNIPQEMDFKAFYRIEDLKNIEIAVLQSLLEEE